jgi:GDP-4-dehydro-6-deoxy-D-mannose reductase
MSNILVTGVNGFVGHHVAHELKANGHSVVGIGGSHGAKDPSSDIDEYLELDLRDGKQAERIAFSSIDAVIHLAGLAAVGPSFDNPYEYIATNIGMEINLFEAAIKQKASPRFLVISSGSLYDPKSDLPLTESSRVMSNSPYAVSKLGQEQMGFYYANRGFEVLAARPFNHIGPGQNLGFLVPDLTQQIIACEQGRIDTVSVGNLAAQRDYTDVRDIALAYRLLLDQGESGEVYNICSHKPVSGDEILAMILKTVGGNVKVVSDPARMRPADAPVIDGSYDKLKNDTGWEPSIALEQTIQDVVSDWRNRPDI